MMRLIVLINYCLMMFMAHSMHTHASDLPRISLQISKYMISAEMATTHRTRAQGLMFRESLAENTGMLFVFPKSAYYGMWMKNTILPLSVAFIDEKGTIINIADMEPDSLVAHRSAGPAKYALEMSSGWFASRKISAGDLVSGLEHAPAAN
ncbi:DUF192 domain-containing protein [Nitrosomonas aestuarii]|uniref:DUF192 domain-containing protein n=1 Tax=Nitrosomonas aestuarii TaxID=52441 RepID=UPI000D45154B|nr:DUF192 domain-containing protein [Nitrosomonas aestuarii]PTN10797.1 hypothetical protein C8R11_11841 [Nitrosomonas aestuarii]